jgi:hypothetical protein
MVIRRPLQGILLVYVNKVVSFSNQTSRPEVIDFPGSIIWAPKPLSIRF